MSAARTGAPPVGARLSLSTSGRLARRAAGGDQSAFEEIFRRYHQELYRYCLAIVHRAEDAEDAVQATMAAAMRALPGDEREIALRPWLYRVAHNESINLLRGRVPAGDPERGEEAVSLPPETELADRDRLRQLVDDLQSLPERQRSAIVMRELSDLSYADIGGALSCSEPSARQTVYEARQGLQDLAEGRAMECKSVREAISGGDRRRLRGRAIRSHLRSCDGCLAFEASIEQRRTDLKSLCPPLPAIAAAGMLSGLLGGTSGGGAAGAAAAGGVGATAAGAGLAGSLAVKGAAVAAAIAVAAGAADVGGLIDVPGPIDGDRDSRQQAPPTGTDFEDAVLPTSGAGPSTGGADGARSDSGPDGQTGSSPGKSESAPGQSGQGSGKSESAPGQTGESPGKSEDAPGHGGSSPGKSDSAPGQTGSSPGKSESAPGQTGTAGSSESAPGQTGSTGNSGSAPGQTGSAGNSGSAPGQTGSAGNSGSAPGQTGSTGKPETTPSSPPAQAAPAPAPAPPKPQGPTPGAGPKPK